MAHVYFPAPLIKKTNVASCHVECTNLHECLSLIIRDFPDTGTYLFINENLPPFTKIFVNQTEISNLDGLDTIIKSDDEIHIIIAISGG